MEGFHTEEQAALQAAQQQQQVQHVQQVQQVTQAAQAQQVILPPQQQQGGRTDVDENADFTASLFLGLERVSLFSSPAASHCSGSEDFTAHECNGDGEWIVCTKHAHQKNKRSASCASLWKKKK